MNLPELAAHANYTHPWTRTDGSRLTLPTPEGGGCSGDARPNGPRWRLTGLPGPTARGAASEEAASTEPCTQRIAHNGETALSPCLKAGACAPTEKVTASAAYVDGKTVGIYAVATLPKVRGKGYGAALTARAAQTDPTLPAVLQA